MLPIAKDSFVVNRFDNLLASFTRSAGSNLLANGGFESNSFTGWTNSNFSVIGATSLEPNGVGSYMARAADSSKGVASSLESSRVAISAEQKYTFALFFGSPEGALKRANNLRILARWFDASSGGNLLRSDELWRGPVRARATGLRHLHKRLTAPSGATHVSLYVANTYGNSVTSTGKGILIDDCFIAGTLENITPVPLDVWEYGGGDFYFRNLKFGFHAQQGCKATLLRVFGNADYIWHLLNTGLGQHLELAFLNGKRWSGMLYSMSGRVGRRSYAASLDSMFNFVKVPYTRGNSESFYTEANPASLFRFGRKDVVAGKSFSNINDARKHAAFLLNEHSFPKPTAIDLLQGEGGKHFVDIEAMGYFTITGWTTGLQPAFADEVDISAAAATLADTVTGGRSILERIRSDTPNDFLSDDYSNVDEMDRLTEPFEVDESQTSMAMLQELFALGTGSKRGIVAGVDANRKFYMHARPTTLMYARALDTDGKHSYFDVGGNEVPRPLVECGNFVTEGAPFPALEVVRGQDAANDFANRFILETEYDHETDALKATFAGWRKLELDLAQMARASGLHTRLQRI